MTGNIIWFSSKGYGFLRSSDESIYFHYTEFEGRIELERGKELEFDIIDGEKGKKAIHIKEKLLSH